MGDIDKKPKCVYRSYKKLLKIIPYIDCNRKNKTSICLTPDCDTCK